MQTRLLTALSTIALTLCLHTAAFAQASDYLRGEG